MVDMLSAVLADGLITVETACAEALRAGVHSSRRHSQHPCPPARARTGDDDPHSRCTPAAARAAADCARYDSLRRAI